MKHFKWAVLIGVFAILLFLEILFFDFTRDDTLVGYRYSENLASGKGPVWNEGERVEGYTDFLWGVLLAGIIKLGFDVEIGSKIAGILFSLFSVYLICAISSLLLEEKDKKWCVLPAVFLGLTPAIAFWAISGMGTVFFLTMILLSSYFFIKEEKKNSGILSAVFFAMLAMSRPEGGLFFGASFIYRVYRAYKKEISWSRLVKWSALFCAIYIPYFAWRFFYFGHLFSNTFYAKKLFLGGSGYLFNYLSYVIPFLILAVVAIVKKPDKIKIYLSILFTMLFIAVLNIAPISGDYFRFIIPSASFLYLLAVFGIKDISDSERGEIKKIFLVATMIGIILIYLINPFTIKEMRVYVETHMEGQKILEEMGIWLKENVPEDSILVTEYAGAPPYYSKLYTIDMWGLVDDYIAHNEISVDYIMGKDPDVFLFSSIYEGENPGSKQGMKELNLLYKDEEFLKKYKLLGEWPYGNFKLYLYGRK